jgi:hypothetical protein
MPSQKDNRAKGVQMTGQQPKILQVAQYIAQMPVLAIEGWQTTSGLTIPSLYD